MTEDNAGNNVLLISRHYISTTSLKPAQQEDLSHRFSERGISVNFKAFTPEPRVGPPMASILGDPSKLIVEITGKLMNKTLLEIVVADLYLFFKDTIDSAGGFKSAGISHYAVIFKIVCDEHTYNVGIDFKDEKTLKINFFRLSQFLKNPTGKITELGVIELEYPKWDSELLSKAPRRLIPTTVAAIIIFLLWETLSKLAAWVPLALIGIIIISYLQIVAGVVWRRVIKKKTTEDRPNDFYSQYSEDASNWASGVNKPGVSRTTELESSNISTLFLAADPTNSSRLRLGEEYREIDEQLRMAKQRDHFILERPQLSLRTKDITGALLNAQPQIVHFSGHGTTEGALCFENEAGQAHLVQPDALAALFKQFANQVNCVILNACYSETQAKAISEHINYVIGMNKAIGDKAAIAFALGFYQALGAGRSIEDAYNLGCVQIRLQGIPEYLTPVLIKKGLIQPYNA